MISCLQGHTEIETVQYLKSVLSIVFQKVCHSVSMYTLIFNSSYQKSNGILSAVCVTELF